jgi:hypothetical protein
MGTVVLILGSRRSQEARRNLSGWMLKVMMEMVAMEKVVMEIVAMEIVVMEIVAMEMGRTRQVAWPNLQKVQKSLPHGIQLTYFYSIENPVSVGQKRKREDQALEEHSGQASAGYVHNASVCVH